MRFDEFINGAKQPAKPQQFTDMERAIMEGGGSLDDAMPSTGTVSALRKIVAEDANDYLWHGSRYRNEVLVPRQAQDIGGAPGSNKNAVYATPDAKVAIAMGLTAPGSDTGMFPGDAQMVLFKGQIRKGEMVYLHKVPKDLFIKHNSREWYSKPNVKEIKPIEIKEIPVDKWLHLIRQATPKDLELRAKYMKQGVAEGKLNESAIFLNPNTVIVGQEHGRPLNLSPEIMKRVQAIAAKHGAWYEGNGADRVYTKGQIDNYVGSFDDDVAKTASPNDPKWLYVLFANVDANNRVRRVGVDPKDTIFNRLLATAKDNSFQGIGFTAQALQKFLAMSSEGKYDFVKMSQQPATQENLTRFLKAGEALMWPSNWEQYPNKAGKLAKAATVDARDQYLASRKAGVYVVGSGHLKAVQQITGKQGMAEGMNENMRLKEFAPGDGEGNGPFDYGRAIIEIGQDFAQHYNDPGAEADAKAIIRVGQKFMSGGMTAGIKAFYDLDTQVRDHVAEQLTDQGFNVRQDIYAKGLMGSAQQDNGAEDRKKILALLRLFVNFRSEPEDRKTVAEIYQAFLKGMSQGFAALYDAWEYNIDADFIDFAEGRGVDINAIARKYGQEGVTENFADGEVKGKSRPGRVKRAGASCSGSVTDLRAKAKKYGGEKGKMYHWCANMKGGKK